MRACNNARRTSPPAWRSHAAWLAVALGTATPQPLSAVDGAEFDDPVRCVELSGAPLRARIGDDVEHRLESEHFVVLYYTTGEDSILHETFPSDVIESLEHAYTVLSTDPRARMHVPAGTLPSSGSVKIEVDIVAAGPGVMGSAWIDYPPLGTPCERSCAGGISLSREMTPGQVRRTTAHEVMHVFQYAVDALESRWMKESTARWAEAFVFPESDKTIDTYASLVYHRSSIWSSAEYLKAYSPLFWDFLEERLGVTVVPEVWAHACSLDGIEAVRQMLTPRGVGVDAMLHEFAVWNYYTGSRDDGAHYSRPFPDPFLVDPDVTFSSFPVVEFELGELCAEEAGSNYLFLHGPASRQNLRVELHGSPEWQQHRIVSWIGTTGASTHWESAPVEAGAEGFVVPAWHRYDQIAVIVTNGVNGGALDNEDLRYTISVREEGPHVAGVAWSESAHALRVMNPGRGGVAIRYRSTSAARPTQLDVYDARGRLVRQLVHDTLPAGDYGAYWDATTAAGDAAAAGVYIVKLAYDGGTTQRKVVMLR